jgi:excisionase family DNA binding protein
MNTILLRPDEAARQLRLSRSKVYSMLKSGELPSVKMGRSVRVPESALSCWLTSQSQPASAPDDDVAVEDALDGAGFHCLKSGATAMDVTPALVKLAKSLRCSNPLVRHVARLEAVSRLTQAGVRTPAKLVALAFGDAD